MTTKDMILEAAVTCFFEAGFHATKMKEVAREAGVGKGTIYEYFHSKEALFSAAIRYNIDLQLRALEGELSGTVDPVEKLRRLYLFETRVDESKRWIHRLVTGEMQEVPEAFMTLLKDLYRQRYEWICEMIGEGIEVGAFHLSKEEIPLAASMLMGLVKETILHQCFLDRTEVNYIDGYLQFLKTRA
jgi:TetR/AcrR family fatty acid metabolism transcriptional regulator